VTDYHDIGELWFDQFCNANTSQRCRCLQCEDTFSRAFDATLCYSLTRRRNLTILK
jgi:hypothetical protein